MSLKSAQQFLDKICKDELLFKKHCKAKNYKKRKQIYKEYGFTFTDDELNKAIDILINKINKKYNKLNNDKI